MEHVFPQIGGAVGATLRVGWIACTAVVTLIEGEEVGGVPGETGGHPNDFRIDSKMSQGAAFEFKDGFVLVAIAPILVFGILSRLAGEGIFEFEGDQGNAVEAEGEIDNPVFCACDVGGVRFFGGFAVLELASDADLVGLVVGFEVGVEAMGSFEGGDAEGATVAFEAMTQDLQATVGVEPFAEVGEDLGGGVVAVEFFQAFPFLGLGLLDKADRNFGEEGAIAVKFFGTEVGVAVIKQMGFDDLLEGCFGVDAHRVDLDDL